jgi:hypothetical protein
MSKKVVQIQFDEDLIEFSKGTVLVPGSGTVQYSTTQTPEQVNKQSEIFQNPAHFATSHYFSA